MEKYGFVYIWFDRKHKRYYIGSHWGTENDGYICSSKWMKNSYKRRPQDFRRRIISYIYSSKSDLLAEENKWLGMIKPEELRHRYYNLRIHDFNHWSADQDLCKTVGQKISASPNRAANISKANKGKKRSDQTKENIRQSVSTQYETTNKRELISEQQKKIWSDSEYRKRMSDLHKGGPGNTKPRSDETKEKLRLINAGKTHSEETKEKLRSLDSGVIYINNGEICRSHPKETIIPEGFVRGKIKRN